MMFDCILQLSFDGIVCLVICVVLLYVFSVVLCIGPYTWRSKVSSILKGRAEWSDSYMV